MTIDLDAFDRFLEQELAPSPETRRVYRRIAARIDKARMSPAAWLVSTVTPSTPKGTAEQYLAGARWAWKFLGEGDQPVLASRRRQWVDLRGEGVPAAHLPEFLEAVEALAEPYRTMFFLQVHAGLRVSEVCDLRKVDIEGHPPRMLSIVGKGRGGRAAGGGKVRQVPVSPELSGILGRYLANDDYAGPPDEPWVFGHLDRGVWSAYKPAALQKEMRALREGLGSWAAKITPHSLRHTFAEQFLERHGHENLVALQFLLGHEDIETTQRYAKEGLGGLAHLMSQMRIGRVADAPTSKEPTDA